MINSRSLAIAFCTCYLLSCKPQVNTQEKEYIITLEQKNEQLTRELEEERNKPPVIITQPNVNSVRPLEESSTAASSYDFFTIGSTQDEVIQVMGDPSEIRDWDFNNEKWLHYGRSYVVLKDNKVKEYHNYEKNLKIKIRQ